MCATNNNCVSQKCNLYGVHSCIDELTPSRFARWSCKQPRGHHQPSCVCDTCPRPRNDLVTVQVWTIQLKKQHTNHFGSQLHFSLGFLAGRVSNAPSITNAAHVCMLASAVDQGQRHGGLVPCFTSFIRPNTYTHVGVLFLTSHGSVDLAVVNMRHSPSASKETRKEKKEKLKKKKKRRKKRRKGRAREQWREREGKGLGEIPTAMCYRPCMYTRLGRGKKSEPGQAKLILTLVGVAMQINLLGRALLGGTGDSTRSSTPTRCSICRDTRQEIC